MNEIAQAVYARLVAQITGVPIYEHVEQDTDNYPLIQYKVTSADNNDDDTNNGFQVRVRVLSFSRYRGSLEINNIATDVYNALHQWSMPDTASYSVGTMLEESRQVNDGPDGLTRYAVQEFICWVDEI
jgi:predicted membrane GTPase involved in stress response